MTTLRIFFLSLLLSLSACGGGSEAPPSVSPKIIYDESAQGPLPYNAQNLTDAQRSRITFDLPEGNSIVRGTSTGGETFYVRLDASKYIQSVQVRYSTYIDNNAHILFVLPYPSGGSKITNVHDMKTVGDHEFTVTAPDQSITDGIFEVYSGSSVQGTSRENPFSLTFTVAKRKP